MLSDGQLLFLNKLFGPDDEVCVSPDKYAYESVPVKYISDNETIRIKYNNKNIYKDIKTDDIIFIAANPIKGLKRDDFVYSFRNFLIEIDNLSITDQAYYAKDKNLPYTAIIFSGNKSLHFIISLTESLPDLFTWKFFNKWIHNILSDADQQNTSPSKGIRFPDNIRPETQKKQLLIDLRDCIKFDRLVYWLRGFGDKYVPKLPEEANYYEDQIICEHPSVAAFPKWIEEDLILLRSGISGQRNTKWFKIGIWCGLQGWSVENSINILSPFYVNSTDFSFREWKNCIINGNKIGLNLKNSKNK